MSIEKALESGILTALGKRIKQARIKAGWSQIDLSRACKMEKSSVSKIESGQVNISYLTLLRLSKCLNVPVKELLES
jgi:transcriptional regulator with XRE-family HTH domain